MQSIEIDFEVFKALTALRQHEGDTYNHVLRSLLRLPKVTASNLAEELLRAAQKDKIWDVGGIRFPAGSEFRARYKGKIYKAEVVDGALMVNNRRAVNPSNAANMITGNNVNGWRFWEARLPGQTEWRRLDSFRGRIG